MTCTQYIAGPACQLPAYHHLLFQRSDMPLHYKYHIYHINLSDRHIRINLMIGVPSIGLPLFCHCTLQFTNLMTSLHSSRPNLSDVTMNSMSFVLVLTKISFLFTSNLTSNFIIVNQRLFDLHLFSSISSILLQCFIIKFTKTERGPHSLHMFHIKSWKFYQTK